jgi:hypothetical protein
LGDTGVVSEAVSAETLAARLWSEMTSTLWVEPLDGAEGNFPQEIPEVKAILLRNLSRISRAWLHHSEQPEWLFLWVMDLCESSPDDAWPLVLELVGAARDEGELARVAAGPLERLLSCQGQNVIERVELEAAANPRFHVALSGVWRSTMPGVIWARLANAIGKGPALVEGEPRHAPGAAEPENSPAEARKEDGQ